MTTLLIADHDNASLQGATLHTVTAAHKMGGDVHVLVAGANAGAAAQAAAQLAGVAKVLHADAPHFGQPTAENVAATVVALVKAGGYSHVLASATGFGKNVAPRVAALLDVAQISEITAIEIRRHVRAADLRRQRVRNGAVEGSDQGHHRARDGVRRAPATGGSAAVESVAAAPDTGLSKVTGQELTKSDRPELTSARVVISGGRGLGSAENFKLLEALATSSTPRSAPRARRSTPATSPNDYQVGQTGKIVAPDLYIAVGISGAIQHLAGMKDSKVIVAINKDPEAPIFQIADYGLVGDLFQILPELTAALG